MLLIVEDDPHYARVLRDLARVAASRCWSPCAAPKRLRLGGEYRPTAITLDIFLPDMLGWTVLARLKQDSATRHIPVQIVTIEEERHHGIERGAFAYLAKPLDVRKHRMPRSSGSRSYAEPRVKRLLVVEDEPAERMSIEELIAHDDVEIDIGRHGRRGAGCAAAEPVRLRRAGPAPARHDRFRAARDLQQQPALRDVPIVVFTGKDLAAEEEERLRKLAKSIVLKGVESPERLLDETALFLHRVIADLPADKQRMVEELHESTRRCAARRCWWWTTTCATSSRCRACSNATACTW